MLDALRLSDLLGQPRWQACLDRLAALAPAAELWLLDPEGAPIAASPAADLPGPLGDLCAAPVCVQGRALGALAARSVDADTLSAWAGLLSALAEAAHEQQAAAAGFVSTVAHQLKAPMTAIKGFAALLAGQFAGPLSPTQREYLRITAANIDRLAALLDDLRDLAELDAGGPPLHLQPVAVAPLAEGLLESRAATARARDLRLACRAEGEPRPAWADPDALRRILSELVANACQYTPDGGRIEVSIANGPAAPGEPPRLWVRVADSGIGIAAEDQPRVFDLFFRADDPLMRDTEGSGLGLAIAQRLAARLGGEIALQSAPGAGSAFTLRLPAA
ncbi:MAG: HAMP domain-containing histidine kinase [Chloroflexi bacterium]|nr:HAMP domain-containing histidine kinase [Chloroflexota bacterium]